MERICWDTTNDSVLLIKIKKALPRLMYVFMMQRTLEPKFRFNFLCFVLILLLLLFLLLSLLLLLCLRFYFCSVSFAFVFYFTFAVAVAMLWLGKTANLLAAQILSPIFSS